MTTSDIPTSGWSEEAYIRRLMQMGGLRFFPRTLRYHARQLAQKNNGAPGAPPAATMCGT